VCRIEEIMNGLGWKRIKDKSDEGYKLRWCELKGSINYNSFKEGVYDVMTDQITPFAKGVITLSY